MSNSHQTNTHNHLFITKTPVNMNLLPPWRTQPNCNQTRSPNRLDFNKRSRCLWVLLQVQHQTLHPARVALIPAALGISDINLPHDSLPDGARGCVGSDGKIVLFLTPILPRNYSDTQRAMQLTTRFPNIKLSAKDTPVCFKGLLFLFVVILIEFINGLARLLPRLLCLSL